MDTFLDYTELYRERDLIMWLDISTHCNAKCPQCHRTNPNGLEKVDWLPLIQWSLEEFVKAFPPLTMQHIRRFDICGTWGDPMMNRDIFNIVKYIINNSSSLIQINTNGSIRNSDWWWSLGVTCANRLEVIFDIEGTTQKQHSLYRQNTNLKKILDNMETLSFTKSIATVFCVVFKHNQESLYDIAKMCRDKGATKIRFIQSDRWHPGKREFTFVVNGKKKILIRADTSIDDEQRRLPVKIPFYNRAIDLFDPYMMEEIENECLQYKV
jgi:MoaA/NifB/PqqE/SkfB family radical SAM enzyme